MATFLVISKHTAEKCPIFNPTTRKVYMDWLAKAPTKTANKYGVKVLGGWAVLPEHCTYFVVEAPSLEAFQKASMEPEALALSATETGEVKIATSMEDAMKMLQQAK